MTWQESAARLGEKIQDAETLDEKLRRLLYAARGLWNDFMRLSITKDRLLTARSPDQEQIDAIVRTMQARDGELYAIESQVKATDRAILELPSDTDPVITYSSHKRRYKGRVRAWAS